jgi:hypothetical protein
MCKQVGDDFYLQWKVEDCPYHTTITSATKISDEIYRLRAENAALRERLKKAVELPCKIGDEVYEVHGKCDGKNCPYNGYYGQWRCSYGGKTNCNPFITVNKFCYSDIPRVGKTIFVTKEAAEARLAELKGGKE